MISYCAVTFAFALSESEPTIASVKAEARKLSLTVVVPLTVNLASMVVVVLVLDPAAALLSVSLPSEVSREVAPLAMAPLISASARVPEEDVNSCVV